MNEIQLRALLERHTYLTELEERKATVLNSIREQGKLTDELKTKIEECLQKTELEDLYLPYKPEEAHAGDRCQGERPRTAGRVPEKRK